MSYRIPSEDEVAKAIENCLVRTQHIRSQRELCEKVSAELLCQDQTYRIGAKRIRRIGVSRGLFTLDISYASTSRDVGDFCPVCGTKLRSVKNMTLDGDTVELMRTCGMCGYTAKGEATKPARYVVTRRIRHPLNKEDRIALLKEAETLLNEAADIMDAAIKMSGLELRSNGDSDKIRHIASDRSYGGSLRNLALDLERLEDDPLWTQPLTSPKNMYEKLFHS